MKFSDIVGQTATVNVLRRMADSGKIPHAILISGPQGVGKMRIARAMAQYVHCRHRSGGEACGRCSSCLQHASFNNPDLHFIFPIVKRAKEKRELSRDFYPEWQQFLSDDPYMSPEGWESAIDAGNSQPRIYVTESQEILRISSLSPFSEDKKIFIIWQPEKMNEEVANKLLKIIEEPFDDTIFLLVSNNPELILPTVYSRLTRINVSRIGESEIAEQLAARGLDERSSYEIARLSEGNLGKAIEMSVSAGENREFNDLFIDMMRTAYIRNIARLKDLSEAAAGYGREKNRRFLAYCGRMVRENFIYNYGIGELNRMNGAQETFSRKFSPFINSANVERMTGEIGKAELEISRNANARIVMFHLMLIFMMELRKNK